jgi:CheY-like chemotaxis protein
MEELGGWLHVQSAPGQGTTVTLGLPFTSTVSTPEVSADEGQAAPPEARTAGVRRLLLVDDHAMVRQGLRAILDHYPDLVVIGEAADGREAVSIASKRAPDVVIMDINMPRMDGIEATRRIKKDHPATVIIAVSVNDTPQIRESMQRAGASAFLSKEEAGERLYETIVSMASPSTDWPHRGPQPE